MADKKSREGEYVIWGCMECGHNHYFHKNDYGQDGLRCEECNGLVNVKGFTNQKPLLLRTDYSKLKEVAKQMGEITMRLDIDCSDALTGLKAVQREARQATKALRELEEQQKRVDAVCKEEIEPCPMCKSESVEKIEFYKDSESIQTINKCNKCEWTYDD